jgi:hypothetical protein
VIDAELGDAPDKKADKDELNIYVDHTYDYTLIKCVILTSMELELHKCFEHHVGPFEIVEQLKNHVSDSSPC